MIGKPFIPPWQDLRPYIAELWLVGGILAVLLAPMLARRTNRLAGGVALVSLVLALVSLLAVGGLAQSAGVGLRGMLVSDPFAVLFKSLLLLFVIGIVLMWMATTAPAMHEGDGPEFFALLLGATCGMALMASATNLMMIVMAVELASLPSYVLAGFRKTDRVGSEASLKYVLFGAAASSVMIYGLSMLYGLCGSLQIDAVARLAASGAGGVPLVFGLVGLLVGIGFKISAVPLHFWCPDVFEGAGIDVSAFLSVASKGAGIALLLRVVMTLADAAGYHGTLVTVMAVILGAMGAITATVGNTAAFAQDNIKRLLAYSSIAHAGYMLCALALLLGDGDGTLRPVAQAILVYLAVYLFMNLGAFTAAGLIYRATGSEDINDYAGIGRRSPLLAACLTICLLSLVGLPPFAGFIAKLQVMVILAQGGGWFWTLVGVIGVNTVLSLYYYVRVIKVMYLSDSDQPAIAPAPLGSAVTLACAAMLVIMLIAASPLLRLADRYAAMSVGAPAAMPTAVAER